jgi:hypothetical protein
MASLFFIQIIVLAACFQKTGGIVLYWLLAHAKIGCDWRSVAYKLYPSGQYYSRMQIVSAWPPIACNMNTVKSTGICMPLAATRVQFACHWRPLSYDLHATGGHSGTICMPLAATRVQFACHWRPLGYNLYAPSGHSGTICMRLAAYSCYMRLAATRVQFACHWRPLGYSLYATGRQSYIIILPSQTLCVTSLQ